MSKNKGFAFLNPDSEEGKEYFKIIKEYLECYSDKFWKEYFDKKEGINGTNNNRTME